jgi:hypothetical protein
MLELDYPSSGAIDIGISHHSMDNQAPKRQFSSKIHFMDICPCLKHTTGLIFSSLVVKRSFIGVSMKICIAVESKLIV